MGCWGFRTRRGNISSFKVWENFELKIKHFCFKRTPKKGEIREGGREDWNKRKTSHFLDNGIGRGVTWSKEILLMNVKIRASKILKRIYSKARGRKRYIWYYWFTVGKTTKSVVKLREGSNRQLRKYTLIVGKVFWGGTFNSLAVMAPFVLCKLEDKSLPRQSAGPHSWRYTLTAAQAGCCSFIMCSDHCDSPFTTSRVGTPKKRGSPDLKAYLFFCQPSPKPLEALNFGSTDLEGP